MPDHTMKITTTLLFLALFASFSLVFCEKNGPGGKIGEARDKAVEKAAN
jgi:hypothetical protein